MTSQYPSDEYGVIVFSLATNIGHRLAEDIRDDLEAVGIMARVTSSWQSLFVRVPHSDPLSKDPVHLKRVADIAKHVCMTAAQV